MYKTLSLQRFLWDGFFFWSSYFLISSGSSWVYGKILSSQIWFLRWHDIFFLVTSEPVSLGDYLFQTLIINSKCLRKIFLSWWCTTYLLYLSIDVGKVFSLSQIDFATPMAMEPPPFKVISRDFGQNNDLPVSHRYSVQDVTVLFI